MAGANKGEWSELEVFYELLLKGEVESRAKDSYGNSIVRSVSRIERRSRKGSNDLSCYYPIDSDGMIKIVDTLMFDSRRVDASNLSDVVNKMKCDIRSGVNKGSFDLPYAREMMEILGMDVIKSPSKDKVDLYIYTDINIDEERGYACKSELAAQSSLVNASEAGNIVYEVKAPFLSTINFDLKAKKFVQDLYTSGGHLEFHNIPNEKFRNNLGETKRKILSSLLIAYYKTAKMRAVKDLISVAYEIDSFGIDKIVWVRETKDLLEYYAKEGTHTIISDGFSGGVDGLLIVRKDKGPLIIDDMSKNDQSKYLYDNSYFDTPSTKRHKCCVPYEEDGKIYFKGSFAIRLGSKF